MTLPVKLRDFTGRITILDLDPSSNISLVKDSIVQALNRPSRPALAFKGHELRDHRTLSYYNICKMNTVHMLPPKKDQVTLQFEKPDGTQFELQVDPHLTVAQLSNEIAFEEKMDIHNLKFIPLSDDIDDPEACIVLEPQELPVEASISTYPLSGATIFVCGPPPPFTPSASMHVCVQLCDGQRLDVMTSLQHTLCEFRGAVLEQYELSIIDHVLVLASKEVTGEDMPLWDLGFFQDCTVHSLPFVLLDIVIEDLTDISGLWLHPLTRLSALRQILHFDVPEIIDTDEYRFTLNGITFLNEWSSLWDLDIASGMTVYLNKYTFRLMVSETGRRVVWVDSHENETVKAFKKRYADLEDMDPNDLQLRFGLKWLGDSLTLKEEGLVTGRRVFARWSSPRRSSHARAGSSKAVLNTSPAMSTISELDTGPSDFKYDPFHDSDSVDVVPPTSDVTLTSQHVLTAVDVPDVPDAVLPEQSPSSDAVGEYVFASAPDIKPTSPDATPSSLYLTPASFVVALPPPDASSMETPEQDKPTSDLTTLASPHDTPASSMTTLISSDDVPASPMHSSDDEPTLSMTSSDDAHLP